MALHILDGVTYDDVLLVPKHSDVRSRGDVDTSVTLGRGIMLALPIIPANMKTVTGTAMATLMARTGGLALLHRFCTVDEQVAAFKAAADPTHVGASIGVKDQERARAAALVAAGCRILCVDVAHGDHVLCETMVRHLRAAHPEILLIAGNVATSDGALRLWHAGADVIKVGVGPGSLCTTRIETGNGVPQLTALADVHAARARAHAAFTIIADGGIRNAGDIVKALCFAEAVMVGSLLAGTAESPGEPVIVDGQRLRRYEGSSTHKPAHVEGVTALVDEKGPAANVIARLMEGVRSGCSYQGVASVKDLQRDPVFVRISHAGLTESLPHGA